MAKKTAVGFIVSEAMEAKFRAKVAAIAQEFKLSDDKHAELGKELRNLSSALKFKLLDEQEQSAGAALKALQGIEKSVRRLASFAQAGSVDDRTAEGQAYASLLWEARNRADKNDAETLTRLQIKTTAARTGDAIAALDSWLSAAPLVRDIVQKAMKAMEEKAARERKAKGKPAPVAYFLTEDGSFPVGPIKSTVWRWAIGEKLTELYTRMTGKAFAVRQGSGADAGTARDVEGVRFVRLAVDAMGYKMPSPETIKSLAAPRRTRSRSKRSR